MPQEVAQRGVLGGVPRGGSLTMEFFVASSHCITSCGVGVEENFEALLAGKRGFSEPLHFDAKGKMLGVVKSLQSEVGCRESIPAQQSRAIPTTDSRIERLWDDFSSQWQALRDLPPGVPVYIATTVGAVDCIELGQDVEGSFHLVEYVKQSLSKPKVISPSTPGIPSLHSPPSKPNVHLISSACASGQSAVIAACMAIHSGRCEQAAVVGVDIVSEFVHSGFTVLGAIAPGLAAPYDRNEFGLTLGEGIGGVLISKSRGANDCGSIIGWGESCDAAHITSPDLEGKCLAKAINAALEMAHYAPADIAGIVGHGTGTQYNDAAEIRSLRTVFGSRPLFSPKANWGHTLGATGVLQIIVALEMLRAKTMPPQAGLLAPIDGAENFVSGIAQALYGNKALSINVGFGGINSVIGVRS